MDLIRLTNEQYRLWLDGYFYGYSQGLDAGGDLRDIEWSARHRAAVELVQRTTQWTKPQHQWQRERERAALMAELRKEGWSPPPPEHELKAAWKDRVAEPSLLPSRYESGPPTER